MPKRIEVTAEPPSVVLMAGETAEVMARVRNTGQTIDQLVVGIEGLHETWYSIPVTSVALFPNDQDSLRITLHPPREAESRTGLHPFRIVVRSHESPEVAVAEVAFEIKPRLEVAIDVSPDEIKARRGTYQVILTNPSNTDLRVRLSGFDAGDRLRYRFNLNMLNVPAGGQAGANVQARLRWWAWLGGEKEFLFHVAAAPPEAGTGAQFCPYCGHRFKGEGVRLSCPHCGKVLAEGVRTAEARLVRPPLIKGLPRIRIPWFSAMPRIESFTASTENQIEFTLRWSVKKASEVTLNGEKVPARGETAVHPRGPMTYTLVAINRGKSVSQSVEVRPLTISEPRTCERLRVSLAPEKVEAYAGNVPATVTLQIQNIGTIVDKFLVEVEGIDGSWYKRSASSVGLMPQASDQVQITFQPPKKEGVRSGGYAFAVVIRSESNPQESAVVTGRLEILPAPEFKIQLRPVRATCRKKAIYRVALVNTGVSDLVIKVDASDMEEGCRFEIKEKEVTVPAWRTVEIPMVVRPKRGSFIGEKKRFDLTVNASPNQGVPLTATGELTHAPLFRSWRQLYRITMRLIILTIVIVGIIKAIHWGGGWDQLTDDPAEWLRHLRRGTYSPWW